MVMIGPEPSSSEAGAWRRWTPAALPVFARVTGLRWPPMTDLAGRPLPPVAALTDLISDLQAYAGLSLSDAGLRPARRRAVLAALAASVQEAVDRLRAQNLDLLWRLDAAPAVPSPGLAAALAIDRRSG